jgi:HEPN domain-containing protein
MNDEERWVMEWFEKADHDLRAARVILNLEDPPLDTVFFHTQQCVEKCLKGFLTFHQTEFRKTHDLSELLTECSKIDPSFSKWEKICKGLNTYAVETRYPGSPHEYSFEDAEEAFSSTAQLREFVRSKIRFNVP